MRDILDGTSNSVAMGEYCVADQARGVKSYQANMLASGAPNPWVFPPTPGTCKSGAHVDPNDPTKYTSSVSLWGRARDGQTDIRIAPQLVLPDHQTPHLAHVQTGQVVVMNGITCILSLAITRWSTRTHG